MPVISPVLEGSKTVFDCLARLENASMYFSATLTDTAFVPSYNIKSQNVS